MPRPERTYFKTLKQYYPFTHSEIKYVLISALVMGFIISFREWGTDSFNALYGFKNLINGIIISILVLLFYISGQRMFGIRTGFRTTYKIWPIGIGLSLALAFATRGYVWLLIPASTVVHHLAGHRLGYFRHKTMMLTVGMINVMGCLACLILATLFKILLIIFPHNGLVYKTMLLAIVFALSNMLPLPPLAGSALMFATRLGYIFMYAAMATYGFLLINTGIIASIFGALFVGLIAWLGFYIKIETKIR